jgi:hypothetical protein
MLIVGEPLWLSGKVVKNEKINEIERTQVCSPPPRATSLKKLMIIGLAAGFELYNRANLCNALKKRISK